MQSLRQKLIKLIITLGVAGAGLLALLAPTLAHAGPADIPPPNVCSQFGGDNCAAGVDTTGKTGKEAQNSLESFLLTISRVITFFAAITAVIFIIIGGYLIVTTTEGSRSVEKGRAYITNAVVGLVVIFLAQLIVEISIGVLKGAAGLK